MSAPVCRTVEEAYQAGRRDAAAELVPTAELADRVAALLAPWLEAIATSRVPRLLTMTQAAEQLGMSRTKFYELVYKGGLPSVELPSRTGQRSTRRVEQAAVDAYIEQHRVTYPATPGGVPPVGGRR